MEDIDECTKIGSLTVLEVLVFKTIIKNFTVNAIEVKQQNISLAYKRVCEIARKSDSIDYHLFDRSKAEMDHFLSKVQHSLELSKTLS